MLTSKYIGLFLLFLIQGLVFNLDLCCELQKLPNLFRHFEEHQNLGDTFWQFLAESYFHDETGEEHHDSQEHDELPFHGTHYCNHAPFYFSAEQKISLDVCELQVNAVASIYRFSFTSRYLEAPFRPPQA